MKLYRTSCFLLSSLTLTFIGLDKADNVRKRGRRGRHQQEEADQDQAKILKVMLFLKLCCDDVITSFYYLFKGLKDVAKDKNHKTIEELKAESLK